MRTDQFDASNSFPGLAAALTDDGSPFDYNSIMIYGSFYSVAPDWPSFAITKLIPADPPRSPPHYYSGEIIYPAGDTYRLGLGLTTDGDVAGVARLYPPLPQNPAAQQRDAQNTSSASTGGVPTAGWMAVVGTSTVTVTPPATMPASVSTQTVTDTVPSSSATPSALPTGNASSTNDTWPPIFHAQPEDARSMGTSSTKSVQTDDQIPAVGTDTVTVTPDPTLPASLSTATIPSTTPSEWLTFSPLMPNEYVLLERKYSVIWRQIETLSGKSLASRPLRPRINRQFRPHGTMVQHFGRKLCGRAIGHQWQIPLAEIRVRELALRALLLPQPT
jgi:hypothetical protein